MPHVHLPHLEDDDQPSAVTAAGTPVANQPPSAGVRSAPPPQAKAGKSSKWLLKVSIEVLLISMGVFLALMGEQWRENAHTRELVETSLRRFREEVLANRKAVSDVKDYHAGTLKTLQAFLAADAKARPQIALRIEGLRPAAYERSAWDLALATGSLANIDPQVALALSRIYNRQQNYSELTTGIIHAMYLRPPRDREAFLQALEVYWDDLSFIEPALIQMYDDVLPQIDRALGESASVK